MTDTHKAPNKWIPHAGVLFCEKTEYNPYQGRILLPGQKNKQTCFRILAVGEGIEGYAVGDLVVAEKVFETAMGFFIRSPYVYGKVSVGDVASVDDYYTPAAGLRDVLENGTTADV